jgi:hypothetical protein
MSTSQPTTISDPSQNPSGRKSDHDIIIALTVLFGTGVACIACACYVNIRRRSRLIRECDHHNGAPEGDAAARDLEAGLAPNVAMAERAHPGRSRRHYQGWQTNDGGISQTALTGSHSARNSMLDRRCSMNSSMMSDYGRSPAGSTFGAQVHGLRGEEDEQQEADQIADQVAQDPPPRYEMALREPPVQLDASGSRSVTPSVASVARPEPAVVARGEEESEQDSDLYRSPTPPAQASTRDATR